jgi:uncharacterized protein
VIEVTFKVLMTQRRRYVGAFADQDLTRLQELIQLNCTSVLALTQKFIPDMKKRKRGAVIIVSSGKKQIFLPPTRKYSLFLLLALVAGFQPLPFHATYAASKSFVSTFGVALWEELKGTGIDMLISEPGSVRTGFGIGAGILNDSFFSFVLSLTS